MADREREEAERNKEVFIEKGLTACTGGKHSRGTSTRLGEILVEKGLGEWEKG